MIERREKGGIQDGTPRPSVGYFWVVALVSSASSAFTRFSSAMVCSYLLRDPGSPIGRGIVSPVPHVGSGLKGVGVKVVAVLLRHDSPTEAA